MKKSFISIAVVAALSVALSASAFAHSGNHKNGKRSGYSKSYSTCSVKSCSISGTHTHSGKTYAAHHDGDGHSYHAANHTENAGHSSHAREGSKHH